MGRPGEVPDYIQIKRNEAQARLNLKHKYSDLTIDSSQKQLAPLIPASQISRAPRPSENALNQYSPLRRDLPPYSRPIRDSRQLHNASNNVSQSLNIGYGKAHNGGGIIS